MKYLKKFEDVQSENNLKQEILKYLEENYPVEWWDREFSDRVYDYVSDDDKIGYGTEEEPDYESEEDAYRNLCMGGAIEYDLLGVIGKDIMEHFNIDSKEYYDKYSNVANDYMMDTIDWYDTFCFHKSGEKYKSTSDKLLGGNIDTINWDDIKL